MCILYNIFKLLTIFIPCFTSHLIIYTVYKGCNNIKISQYDNMKSMIQYLLRYKKIEINNF